MIFIALLALEKLGSALFRYHKRRSKSVSVSDFSDNTKDLMSS